MDEKLTKDLQNNIRIIREHLCLTEDLLNKDLVFVDKNCTILFLESMVNKEHLQSFVIGPMLEAKTGEIERVVEGPDLKAILAVEEIGSKLLEGCCAILKEGQVAAWTVSVAESTSRSIEMPVNERSIKSSHDGFVETIGTNLLLLRRRVKSPQ